MRARLNFDKYTYFFQEKVGYFAAVRLARTSKLYFHIFALDSINQDYQDYQTESNKITYKSAWIVVAQCLGVAERLQQRVGLQDNIFDILHFGQVVAAWDLRYVAHYIFCTHRFAGTITLNRFEFKLNILNLVKFVVLNAKLTRFHH